MPNLETIAGDPVRKRYYVVHDFLLGQSSHIVYQADTTGECMEYISEMFRDLGFDQHDGDWVMDPNMGPRDELLIWKRISTVRMEVRRNLKHPHYQRNVA